MQYSEKGKKEKHTTNIHQNTSS